MKIHLLGTSAAEGFPGIFCRCSHCQKARVLGGKNIRTRTSAIIDDVLKIDFPPDTNLHVLRDQIDLSKVKDLLITHTHSDHLYAEDLSMRLPIYAHGVEYPFRIYAHDLAISKCRSGLERVGEFVQFHLIHPFQTVSVGDFHVTPLLADHAKEETCFIFYIEKQGEALLYGHDTGWFPDATWEWLEGKRIDVAILDCTSGNLPGRRNHMNIEAVKEVKEVLEEKGILSTKSRVIATHFSHNIGLFHEDLEAIFAPTHIEVAYDGMIIETQG